MEITKDHALPSPVSPLADRDLIDLGQAFRLAHDIRDNVPVLVYFGRALAQHEPYRDLVKRFAEAAQVVDGFIVYYPDAQEWENEDAWEGLGELPDVTRTRKIFMERGNPVYVADKKMPPEILIAGADIAVRAVHQPDALPDTVQVAIHKGGHETALLRALHRLRSPKTAYIQAIEQGGWLPKPAPSA